MTKVFRFNFICCSIYSILCVVWVAWVGSFLSFDFLHYHLYVVHAWLEGRLPQELFAASGQSYLNPYPHLPFYVAYRGIANSMMAMLVVAAFHSVNLWLLHFVACELIPPAERLGRFLIFFGVLVGMLSPGFLLELGTGYADIVVSIPAMGALLLLLRWVKSRSSENWLVFCFSWLLLGISAGLKPSMAIYGFALLVSLVLFFSAKWAMLWRALVFGALGGGVGGGEHALMLWRYFDSPVFPLFNADMKSSWFPLVNMVSERFRPDGLLAALNFPLSMADSGKRVALEWMSVDIRPVWLLGIVFLTGVMYLLQKAYKRSVGTVSSAEENFFWLSSLLFFVLWVYSSANIRYAIHGFLLIGPMIAVLASKICGKKNYVAMFLILLPFSAQSALAASLNQPLNVFSRDARSWGDVWFDISVPEELKVSPAYYFSLQMQGYASLAPIFPSGSRFFNLIGQTTWRPDSLIFKTVLENAKSQALPLRTLYQRHNKPNGDFESLDDMLNTQNSLLSDYGYQVIPGSCYEMINSSPFFYLVSCEMVSGDFIGEDEMKRRKLIDSRFAVWEEACPGEFSPGGFASVQTNNVRRRHYTNTDYRIICRDDGVLFSIGRMRDNQPVVFLENAKGERLIDGCPTKAQQ
ncbi:MAG: hypothetical protein LWW83_05080 [Azonexaceae bacterium]|nr:hypothetical protein [Azonexaceae bacterium]